MRHRRSVAWRTGVLVLPAAVAAAVVWWASSAPLRTVLAETRRQQRDIERDQPTAATIAAAEARVGALRSELAAATAAVPQPKAAPPTVVPPTERARWRAQVTTALEAHGLRLVDEDRAHVELPPLFARAFGAVPGGRLPAWSLRFAGAYLDVLAAIGDLASAQLPCHVFELRLRRDVAGEPEWTLVLG